MAAEMADNDHFFKRFGSDDAMSIALMQLLLRPTTSLDVESAWLPTPQLRP
jgi:hypothetical protein